MRKQDPVQRSGNFIKGKLGENIIMRLLRDLDFQVFPNGYEVTHPAFLTFMKKKQFDGREIKKLRMRADFIVVKEANEEQKGTCFEVEVKFRFSGHIEKRELQDYDDDVRFIFVDEKNFWSVSKVDVFGPQSDSNAKLIAFNSLRLLEDDVFFNFSSDQKLLIKRYKNLIGQFLSAPLSPDQSETANSQPEKKEVLPENYKEIWPPDFTEKLIEEYGHLIIRYSSGEAIEILAQEFGRTAGGIWWQLKKKMPNFKG